MNVAALELETPPIEILVRRVENRGGITRLWVERPMGVLLAAEARALAGLQRRVRWPGYRRGSVPESLIRQRYGDVLRETALQDFLQDSVAHALAQQKLIALATPSIETVEQQADVVRFRMSVEVAPEVDIAGYLGIELRRREEPVTESQIDEALATLAHETPDATATPDIRRAVRRLLEVESARHCRRDLERQIADHLLAGHSIVLPPTPVVELTEDYLRRLEIEFLQSGGAAADWPNRRRDVEGFARVEAERRLRLTYLLAGVAQIEGIIVSEAELEHAFERALAALPPAQRLRAIVDLNARRETLRPVLLEEKIYDFLIARARVASTETETRA